MIAGFHFLSSSMWHGWVRCFAFLLDSPENVPSVISGKRWGFNEEHVQQKHLQCLKFLHLVPWGRVKNIKSLCERMCWLSVTGAEDGLWDLSHASRKTVFCTLRPVLRSNPIYSFFSRPTLVLILLPPPFIDSPSQCRIRHRRAWTLDSSSGNNPMIQNAHSSVEKSSQTF